MINLDPKQTTAETQISILVSSVIQIRIMNLDYTCTVNKTVIDSLSRNVQPRMRKPLNHRPNNGFAYATIPVFDLCKIK